IIAFDNSELELRPGTSVDVRVITDEHANALAVPERSTFRYEGSWAVFVVRDGHAHLTPVEVGLKNDDWAEIASGLSEGDTVVSEPGNDLEDGVRVEVLGD
ncbi:MAG: efflux transporter periplasmic adaptor subunit, partial [bacterium]|nr:efflux transporter periplasmic adaptor subunit [bacterium]